MKDSSGSGFSATDRPDQDEAGVADPAGGTSGMQQTPLPVEVEPAAVQPAAAQPGAADPGSARTSIRSWAGYAWFMSFGTILPLVVFLSSYALYLTLVGAPIARRANQVGIWISTFGQDPPGKEKLDSRSQEERKPSIAERIRPYSPPGILDRRGRPVGPFARALWFIFVGWWLGAIWVLLSWSIFLAPYPFLDTVRGLLDELPTVMTLAPPQHMEGGSATQKTEA
jgi:uncharacterized membrane protein YccF (DUF307 family)